MRLIDGPLAATVIGLATAILVVGIGILPFLTPQWIAFEQGRAGAAAWTGYTDRQLREATDSILTDLLLGGDFAVRIDGQAVLDDRERAHMADVRSVFRGLWLLVAGSAVVALLAIRRRDRSDTWRAIRRGALALSVGVVALGAVALVAFEQLFELFHRLFFPAGTYLFDPTSDRLVQLFPFQFWDDTATAAGIVIIGLALLVAAIAGRRTGRARIAEPESDPSVVLEGS